VIEVAVRVLERIGWIVKLKEIAEMVSGERDTSSYIGGYDERLFTVQT